MAGGLIRLLPDYLVIESLQGLKALRVGADV